VIRCGSTASRPTRALRRSATATPPSVTSVSSCKKSPWPPVESCCVARRSFEAQNAFEPLPRKALRKSATTTSPRSDARDRAAISFATNRRRNRKAFRQLE
jgi:hypothetical protein